MNDIMTMDESWFDETPDTTEQNPVQQPESTTATETTATVFADVSNEMGVLSLEDLESINIEGVEPPEAVTTEESKSQAKPVTEDKSNFYASQIEYFKEKGLFPKDLELEEGVVWDADTFEDALEIITKELHQNTELNVRDEFESKLGTNIVQFLENGGDYSTFAELIKEQNVIQNFDIATDSGQKAVVKKYYSEVLKWSDARVDKQIDRLYNDGELEEEAILSKGKFDEYFGEEQEAMIQQQQIKQERQQKALIQRKTIFGQALQETGLVQQDIGNMVDYVFKDSWTMPNGTAIPQLDYDILMLQKNPKELAELVQFLTNKESFLKKKATEINNVKVDKKFKQILQNQTTNKGGGNTPEIKPKSTFRTILT